MRGSVAIRAVRGAQHYPPGAVYKMQRRLMLRATVPAAVGRRGSHGNRGSQRIQRAATA